MRKWLLISTVAVLMLTLSCSKSSTDSGLIEPSFNYDDLVDAWRGTLSSWRVDNTSVGKSSYTLNDIDVTLIFEEQNYWLQLSYFTDSLEYQYYNRGYWLWDPYVPDVMIFEMYQESSSQIFNPVRGTSSDSLGGGGGSGAGGDSTGEPPDTVLIARGDNTEMEERFISYIDYMEDQIRLYDFIEYIDLGDITLDRF